MLDDLLRTRSATVGDDYSGPVLVERDAAPTLVSQSFVSFFLARRTPDSDDPRGEGMSQAGVTPFLTRIGNRVLPESFTVKDTPSMTRFGALPVGGAYAVDDEGVMAQDVTLVAGRPAAHAADVEDAAEEPAGVERTRAGRRPAGGRVPDRVRRRDPGGRAEGEATRVVEDAGAAVRLHHSPARHAGRARHDAGDVGGEGDAGRQGGAGAGVDAERRHAHDVPRHPGGLGASGRC